MKSKKTSTDDQCELNGKNDINCVNMDQLAEVKKNESGRNLSHNARNKMEIVWANQKIKKVMEYDDLLEFKAKEESFWNKIIVDCLNDVFSEGSPDDVDDVDHHINSRTRLKIIERLLKAAMRSQSIESDQKK